MPRTLQKMFDFCNFCSSKRRMTRLERVAPYEILVFPTNFIFFQRNEITLRGKKCTAFFQTHNWEKQVFFNALVRVFAQMYANTCPTPPRPNRVNMCGSCQNRSHSTFGIVYKYSCIFIDLCILIVFVCNNCNVKLINLCIYKCIKEALIM